MLDFDFIDWDDPDDLAGNTWHIAGSGVTRDEVEEVLLSPDADEDRSRASDRPAVFGATSTGKYLIVIYEVDREGGVTVIRPVTAYEVPEP